MAKKKKTKQKKKVVFVLDETGSMGVVRDETISGFNSYIDELQSGAGAKTTKFNLVTFNSLGIQAREEVPLKDVEMLTRKTYVPSHCTPLYDAVGTTINSVKDGTKDVLFIIMTDGLENDSREYDFRKVTDLIAQRQGDGWIFVYLGANHDAWDVGGSLGIQATNAASYDQGLTKETFGAVRGGTAAYIANDISSGDDFFKEEEVKTFTDDPDYKNKMSETGANDDG